MPGRGSPNLVGSAQGRAAAGSLYHIVFTVPAPIAAMAFRNKAIVYAILFRAASAAMMRLAANPRRLGAGIGGMAVNKRLSATPA